jgi:hypothetical protein
MLILLDELDPMPLRASINQYRQGEAPLARFRLVQVPKIISAKLKTARTRFNIAAFAKPACADFDSINSPTPFAAGLNGCIA